METISRDDRIDGELAVEKMYEEMAEPDTEIRPPQHPMCNLLSCRMTLEKFSTRKHIRTYANEAGELGI